MARQPGYYPPRRLDRFRRAGPDGPTAAHPGANDRVRVALCGVRGRGLDHLKNYSQLKNVEIAAICDIDDSVARSASRPWKGGYRQAQERTSTSESCWKTRTSTRSPSPRPITGTPDGHLGLPGRQGRLRREALLAQLWEGAADREGGAASTSAWCSTAPRIRSIAAVREAMQKIHDGLHRQRLHVARASATSGATPSAARGGAGARRRRLRPLAGTGARASRSRAIGSITTGTGSGIRQRRHRQPGHTPDRRGPLGAGRRFPTKVSPSAATSCSTTTRTRQTTWFAPSSSICRTASTA